METNTHKISVKVLDQQYLDWFVDVVCFRMLNEEVKRPELFNKKQLNALSVQIIKDGTAFVAFDNDVPIGGTASLWMGHPFNQEIQTLAELVWYVLPEYRKSRAGFLLMKSLEDKAKELKADLTFSVLPGTDINNSSLEKRGFKLEELAFRKAA
jgi:N-acetylglutamate synthase-like GNAT family acetyltransferase